MTDLEIAAARWKHEVESAAIDNHPSFFVVHYQDAEELAAISGRRVTNEANLVLLLGSPFAMSPQVSDTFVFLDRPGEVLCSHMFIKGRGIQTTQWRLPYEFGDFGKVAFDVGMKLWGDQRIRQACDMLVTQRLKGARASFAVALKAAVKWGEAHERRGDGTLTD